MDQISELEEKLEVSFLDARFLTQNLQKARNPKNQSSASKTFAGQGGIAPKLQKFGSVVPQTPSGPVAEVPDPEIAQQEICELKDKLKKSEEMVDECTKKLANAEKVFEEMQKQLC